MPLGRRVLLLRFARPASPGRPGPRASFASYVSGPRRALIGEQSMAAVAVRLARHHHCSFEFAGLQRNGL